MVRKISHCNRLERANNIWCRKIAAGHKAFIVGMISFMSYKESSKWIWFMIWTRKYIKYAHVQESNHICTARTYARVCGSWAVRPYPILYSLKFLREHPHTSQLLFHLFFPKHLLYSVTNSIVALYSISFVSYSRARLSSSIQEVILPEYGLWILLTVETIFSKKVKLSLFIPDKIPGKIRINS